MHVPDITSSIEVDPARLNVRWTDGAMIIDGTYAQNNEDKNNEDKTKNTVSSHAGVGLTLTLPRRPFVSKHTQLVQLNLGNRPPHRCL